MPTAEHRRLAEAGTGIVPQWRRWGCFASERAWGTVREDYSADGDARPPNSDDGILARLRYYWRMTFLRAKS